MKIAIKLSLLSTLIITLFTAVAIISPVQNVNAEYKSQRSIKVLAKVNISNLNIVFNEKNGAGKYLLAPTILLKERSLVLPKNWEVGRIDFLYTANGKNLKCYINITSNTPNISYKVMFILLTDAQLYGSKCEKWFSL